jgi:hypothetical protein
MLQEEGQKFDPIYKPTKRQRPSWVRPVFTKAIGRHLQSYSIPTTL